MRLSQIARMDAALKTHGPFLATIPEVPVTTVGDRIHVGRAWASCGCIVLLLLWMRNRRVNRQLRDRMREVLELPERQMGTSRPPPPLPFLPSSRIP